MLKEKLAWKEESDECKKKVDQFVQTEFCLIIFEKHAVVAVLLHFCGFHDDIHHGNPSWIFSSVVLQIMQENLNNFCFRSFKDATQRSLCNLQVKRLINS